MIFARIARSSTSDRKFVIHGKAYFILYSRVGADGVVKIADFGLSRDLYGGNYYQSTTSRPLPVKWMAIECLVNNAVFTTKSDVVSVYTQTAK